MPISLLSFDKFTGIMFIYHIENKCSLEKRIEIDLLVFIGSLAETKKNSGMAHLFEHTFVHYLKSKMDCMVKMQYKTRVSAYTEFDHMFFIIECHKDVFLKVLQVLTSALLSYEIDLSNLLKSKEEVLQECLVYSEKSFKQKEMLKILTNNKVSTLPMGEIESLKNIGIEELKDFYMKQFCIAAKKIFIIGNIDNFMQLSGNVSLEKRIKQQRKNQEWIEENKSIKYSVHKINGFLFIKYVGIHSNIYNRVLWEILKEIIGFFYGQSEKTICYEKKISKDYRYIYIKDVSLEREFLQFEELIKFITPPVLSSAIKRYRSKFDYIKRNELFLTPEYLRNEYKNFYLYGECMMIPLNIGNMSKILLNIDEFAVIEFISKKWEK